ncbi:hypothetical protein Dda_1023 [Drechslerella dactyloides]|uniref:RNase H type-1 domain-containing protein n=1 Tax=Drechslerella dactyloides TaxID=74499 RepID=A0AAD6J798_DREDA|nr:hypothetical protein Dda_1023 [Drechslerella dactyloides]
MSANKERQEPLAPGGSGKFPCASPNPSISSSGDGQVAPVDEDFEAGLKMYTTLGENSENEEERKEEEAEQKEAEQEELEQEESEQEESEQEEPEQEEPEQEESEGEVGQQAGHQAWQQGEGSHNDDDGRMPVLTGNQARYIPRWDEHLFGLDAVALMDKDYHSPPTAAGLLTFHYCMLCELNWLVSVNGYPDTSDHRAHLSGKFGPLGYRSLAVWIDGCYDRHHKLAAIGRFFGPGSPHNKGLELKRWHQKVPSCQRAEIAAAIEAMRYVRTVILPSLETEMSSTVKTFRREHTQGPVVLNEREHWHEWRTRLIICTHSNWLVERTCDDMHHYVFNPSRNAWLDRQGKPIQNGPHFNRLREEVESLAKVGVQVVWSLVGKHNNVGARALVDDYLADLRSRAKSMHDGLQTFSA